MGKPLPKPDDPEFRARPSNSGGRAAWRTRRWPEIWASPPTPLRLWVQQAASDAGRRDGLTTDEQAALTRWRREVARLREARQILKQAAAWSVWERATR